MKKGFVYILQSEKNSKYYVGSTQNIEQRIIEHNLGFGGQFTKQHKPWRLVCYKKCSSIAEARINEKKVKAYKGGIAFKRIINGEVPEWPKGAAC